MIFPVSNGLDKLIGKGLGGYIHHPCLVVVVMYIVADGLNQMSFSKPNSPVNEAGVVSGARVLRDGDTRISCKRVVIADNKVLKAVIDAQLIVFSHIHLRQRLSPLLRSLSASMSLLGLLRCRLSASVSSLGLLRCRLGLLRPSLTVLRRWLGCLRPDLALLPRSLGALRLRLPGLRLLRRILGLLRRRLCRLVRVLLPSFLGLFWLPLLPFLCSLCSSRLSCRGMPSSRGGCVRGSGGRAS